MYHLAFTVKNTFIADHDSGEVDVEAEAIASSGSRRRSTSADVATLISDTRHPEEMATSTRRTRFGSRGSASGNASRSGSGSGSWSELWDSPWPTSAANPVSCSTSTMQKPQEVKNSEEEPLPIVCPEVGQAVEQGLLEASEVFEALRGSMKALALDDAGHSLLRILAERLDDGERRQLADEFRGSVIEMAQHPASAKALAQLAWVLPSDDIAFVSQELSQCHLAVKLATTSLGGAELLEGLFQRRHWLAQSAVRDLAWELLHGELDVPSLCCNKYAHLVLLALVRLGSLEYQELVIDVLLPNMQRYSRHRYASKLVCQLLEMVPSAQQEAIADAVMSASGAVCNLSCHCFGSTVVRAMLQVQSAQTRARVMQYLRKGSPRILKDKFGAALLQEMEGLSS